MIRARADNKSSHFTTILLVLTLLSSRDDLVLKGVIKSQMRGRAKRFKKRKILLRKFWDTKSFLEL